jgi:hypothetical protein
MKKINLTLFLLIIFGSVYAQDPVITFRFSNFQIVSGMPDTAQFDVEIKCDQSGTYHRDMQIYFNYNSIGFGSNIYTNNRIVVEKLALMNETVSGADKYIIVAMNDNTASRFALATETSFPNFDPTAFPLFYTPVTTEFQGFLRIKIAIADNSELSGISFEQSLMNGGQYYQGNANPIAYQNPSLYDNDLENEPLWITTANTTWTGANSSQWNDQGNWTNSIPWEETNTTIPDVSGKASFPVLDVNANTNNLTIQPNGKFTISNTKSMLNVAGDLLLDSDATGTASIIEFGNINVTGATEVKQYLAADVWHYVSSPINGATASVFENMYLKYFNEPTNDWTYIYDLGELLELGRGYAVWSTSNEPVSFNGNLNNTEEIASLSFTDNNPHGFNMIGNPFPSAIDWDLISSGNKINIDASIYVWNGATYLIWNGQIGSLNDGIIPPMQGFFVHANNHNASVKITNDSRIHTDKQLYKGKHLSKELENLLAVSISGNGYSDMTHIYFKNEASYQFDPDYDAYKLFGIEDNPYIYSIIENNDLAINVLPVNFEELVIPIGVKTGIPGQYTIDFSGIDSFDPDLPLIIEDLLTSQLFDLKQSNIFEITSGPANDPHRFNLHFVDVLTSNTDSLGKRFTIYGTSGNIRIIKHDNSINDYKFEIYDLQGRLMMKNIGVTQKSITVNLPQHSHILIVRIITKKYTFTKKINF